VAAAARHGVALASGPNFAPQGGMDQWMRLPFTLPEDRLAQAPPRLARAWEEAVTEEVRWSSHHGPIIA